MYTKYNELSLSRTYSVVRAYSLQIFSFFKILEHLTKHFKTN